MLRKWHATPQNNLSVARDELAMKRIEVRIHEQHSR